MSGLAFTLLGGLEIRSGGRPLEPRSRKGKALLAFLAMSPDRRHSRDRLATLLWADRTGSAARANLRNALFAVRRDLPDSVMESLCIDAEAVSLAAQGMDVDAIRFRSLAASPELESLEQATDLYRGDFLDGFDLGAPVFDDWIAEQRQQLREIARQAMSRLLDHKTKARDADGAIAVGLRLLALDPLQEPVHRDLMRLYARQGRRDAAVRQFEECRRILDQELGVVPEKATRDLHHTILLKRGAVPATPNGGSGDGGASDRAEAGDESQAHPVAPVPLRGRGLAAMAGVAMVVAVLVAVAAWPTARTALDPPGEIDPALAMPTGPSVLVLPFENLSGDPTQDYFVEGLTQEIVTALSRFSDLTVISQDASFRDTSQALDMRGVDGRPGPRFVVDGSVRRSWDTIRINAQLINVETDAHLWSDTFERVLTPENVFAIQDEITAMIASTIGDSFGVIAMTGARRTRGRAPASLDAYDCVLRAVDHYRYIKLDRHASVRDCLEETVAAHPDYGIAWSWLSWVYTEEYSQGLNPRPGSLDRALEASERAVRLAPRDARVQINMATVRYFRGELEAFLSAVDRALALNPNDSSVAAWAGHRLAYAGHWGRALALNEKARAMNPYHAGWYHFTPYFDAYRRADYEAALMEAQKLNSPGYVWALAALAAAYGQLGRGDDAAPIVARILALRPDFEATAHASRAKIMPYQLDLVERLMDGLRKAGLDIRTESGAQAGVSFNEREERLRSAP